MTTTAHPVAIRVKTTELTEHLGIAGRQGWAEIRADGASLVYVCDAFDGDQKGPFFLLRGDVEIQDN